ncbi:EamA family transporter [Candidiatus Paracoxiella cheracis]|uniref:EamA family transporter n=1 Tax=Candidiatus Paracoxiella cheracis TaxID=3405120 RepID=UPI003BF5A7A8
MSLHFSSSLIAGIAYLAIFPSILAYLLWNKGISQIGATRGEVFTHFVPISGAVLSVVFLKTPLFAYHYIGALFIATGVILCSRKPKPHLAKQSN